MPKVYSPISQDFYQEKYVKAQRKCVAEINTVMAAVAVRKKVVSSGQFSPCFHLQSLKSFFLLDRIKSNCMY